MKSSARVRQQCCGETKEIVFDSTVFAVVTVLGLQRQAEGDGEVITLTALTEYQIILYVQSTTKFYRVIANSEI